MNEVQCLLCGKCCYLMIDNKISNVPCPHLVKLKDGKTLCRIFNRKDRIGTQIGYKNTCNQRINVKRHYDGCPFNNLIKLEENENGKNDR